MISKLLYLVIKPDFNEIFSAGMKIVVIRRPLEKVWLIDDYW